MATSWLLTPSALAFVAYEFVLLGVMVMDVFGEAFWSVALWLAIGPVVGWMVLLVVVGVFMERRYLRPARIEWKALHPPFR